MSKVAGFIIGAIEVGIGIATGNVALIVQGGLTIAAQAIVDLTAPKQPAREASEMTIKLGEQPRAMQLGETFTPGSLVDGFDFGGKYGTDWECLVIRLADHKCHSLVGFFVNDTYYPYNGDGLDPRFDDQFKIYFRADTTTDPLPSIVTDNGPGWSASDIGESGCDVIVAYKADKPNDKHPGWPAGRPRFGFVIKGKLCYDLRKDSTVSGGSGSHRWTDPTTWEWSENAIVCWYNYERGVFTDDDVTDQTKLLVGRGLTADQLPPDDLVIAAANLCDELAAAVYPAYWYPTVHVMLPGYLSPDGTVLYSASGSSFASFYIPTRSQIVDTTLAVGPSGGQAATNDGLYFANFSAGIYLVSKTGVETLILPLADMGMIPGSVSYAGGDIWIGPHSFDPDKIGKYDGTLTVYAVNFNMTQAFSNAAGGAISVGTTSGHILAAGHAGSAAVLNDTTAYGTTGDVWGFDPDDGTNYICRQGDYLFFIDKTTFTINAAVNTGSSPSMLYEAFASTPVGSKTFWNGNSEYSSADLSLVRTIDTSPFTVPNLGGFEGSGFVYDPLNNALISPTNSSPGLVFRFLDRDGHYRVAGPIYANQPFIDVEQMFAAATAGSILTREGSVMIEPGQAKSVVATFTDDDLLIGSKVSWNQGFLSESSDEWINTVVATYVEPDQKWNSHAAPVVRNTSDITGDNEPREAQIALRLVRYQPQALRIAEIARRLGRIWGRGAVTLGPRFCELEDGDWVQWQSDRYFSGGTKTFRIEAYSIDEKWQNTLTLREIVAEVFADDAVFPYDYSQPTMTAFPPDIGAPDSANWALAAVTLDSPAASIPALEITGSAADDIYAEAIIFEYWEYDGVTDPTMHPDVVLWIGAGRYPVDTTKVDITSITGGRTYYAAVSYVVQGIPSDRLILGPVTVADLIYGPHRTADTTTITADDTIHKADMA